MNYPSFIDAMAQRAGVSPEQAEILTRATLETLSERLSGGEALDLAAQLPKALHAPLRPRFEAAESFGVDEFVRRVSARAGVDEGQARNGTRTVLATLRQATTAGEFQDVMSQLPKEYHETLEPVAMRGPASSPATSSRP